jgi:hypothetical protein
MAAARLVLSTKNELRAALARLSADGASIHHAAWGAVDCRATYLRNVKKPPTVDGFTLHAYVLTITKKAFQ